jgi:hypothetical protein
LKTFSIILISLVLVAVGTAGAQTVTINPYSFSFSGLVGGNPVSQNLSIIGGNTTVAILPSQPWLTVSQPSGVTLLQVNVIANPVGLAAGTYTDDDFRVVSATQTIVIPALRRNP